MEILCTLSFISVVSLLFAVGYTIAILRDERRRRVEADEALYKVLSEISRQFASMLDALDVAGVVQRADNLAKGIALDKLANLGPDQLAHVDAIAAKLGMTREQALLYIAQQGLGASKEQIAEHLPGKEVHCKGPLCAEGGSCMCICIKCRRARRGG